MDFEKYFDRIYSDYDRYFIIPVILLLMAAGFLGFNYLTQGEFLSKGLDFQGGTEIQLEVNQSFNPQEIEQIFSNAGRDVTATEQITQGESSLIIQAPSTEFTGERSVEILGNAGYDASVLQSRKISSAVGESFFLQAQLAFLMAFTIMSLVIFYAFKDLTPSMAVIFAAAGDILFAMAGMAFFNIPMTLGSLAALLMLIGYSVDTDIVLSTRVLKRQRGSLKERIWSSVKTGVTMSSGGIAGFALLYIVSIIIVGPSELSNIAAVMVIGLLADMPFTWFGNAIILKKYEEGSGSVREVIPWI